MKIRSHNKAQTIIELAVFGGVLIFILGLIIRQGLSFGYIQHQNLKAMRLALTMSYMYSEGLKDTSPANSKPGKGAASRNVASVFIIEDRLSADASKYGTIDRSPYINSASGTYSRLLFMPFEPDYDNPIPPSEIGKPRRVPPEAGDQEDMAIFDLYVNGVQIPLSTSALMEISMTDPNAPEDPVTHKRPNIPYYFTTIPNNPKSSEWCIEGGVDCPCIRKPDPEKDDFNEFVEIDPALCEKFDANRRFHLRRCAEDRAQEPDCLAGKEIYIPQDKQETFGWQWSVIDARDLKKGNQIDIDKDLKDETVLLVDTKNNKILYMDDQMGDVDFSISEQEGKIPPGLKPDMQILTKTKEGTYLFINEGRLYDANNQFVRTASKKDSVDIVQRVFQLSNDTGRFCQNGQPTDNDYIWTKDYPKLSNGKRNPVEACGNCFSPENMDKTCMELNPDRDVEGEPPVLYIRSRILDQHGRNWVTNIHDDTYIKFEGK